MKVEVKLGSAKSRGFYPVTGKDYTEIQEGKMPFNVLKVLDSEEIFRCLGMHELTLSERVVEIQPELTVDEYGYLVSLPSLMKDFTKGNLVTKDGTKYKITKLGRDFLKNNVIKG